MLPLQALLSSPGNESPAHAWCRCPVGDGEVPPFASCCLLVKFSQQMPSVLTVLPSLFCISKGIRISHLKVLNLLKEAHPSTIYLEWCQISLSGYLFSCPVGARPQSGWYIKNDTFYFSEDIVLHYSKCFLRYPIGLNSLGLLIILGFFLLYIPSWNWIQLSRSSIMAAVHHLPELLCQRCGWVGTATRGVKLSQVLTSDMPVHCSHQVRNQV